MKMRVFRYVLSDHLCIGQTLRVEGKVLELKGKHEAVMEGSLSNSDGTICTRSTANFAIFSPAVAKRLGIANEEHLSWFEQIYNMKRRHKNE